MSTNLFGFLVFVGVVFTLFFLIIVVLELFYFRKPHKNDDVVKVHWPEPDCFENWEDYFK